MSRKYYNKYEKFHDKNSNKLFNNYKKNENNSNNIPEKYIKLLTRKWSSPSVLSNSILLTFSLDKFCYTEKIDGLHTHLLIFDKKIYNVSKSPDLSLIKKVEDSEIKNMNFEGDCILEAEYYNNIYFIFDVYYLNGIDYSKKYIFERIEPIKQFINELGPNFKLKNYYTIPDLNYLLEYTTKN